MPDSGQGAGYPNTAPRPDDPTQRTNEGLFREIAHLRELLEERIAGVVSRIDAQKELTDALFKASTDNVATAFTAAKEAVSKQDADTTKRIEGIQAMLRTMESGLAQRFEDMKGRLDRGEGKSSGLGTAGGIVASVIGVLVALLGIAVAFFASKG